MQTLNLQNKSIFQLVFISSLVISAYLIWQDDAINANGYTFLRASQLFLDGDFDAARRVFYLPFYPILLASVTTVTGLTLEYSAYLANSLLLAVMAVAFGKIIIELSNDRRVLLIAITLLLAHPKINDNYRTAIIRDPGYWAFYLVAVLNYLRFWKHPRMKNALGWGAAVILATLFRYEGVVFLLFAPLFIFLKSSAPFHERLRQYLKLNTILLSACIVILILGLLTGIWNHLELSQFTKLISWTTNVIPNTLQMMLERADRLSDALFYEYPYSREYALSGVILTLLLIFVTEIASSLTYFYTPFSFHSIIRRIYPKNIGISVIAGFTIINAIILLVYLSRHLFVTGRYVIPLVLLLLVFASFSIVHLYDHWVVKSKASSKLRWGGIFIVVIFLITALDGLISTSPSKAYERQAGEWLKKHSPDAAKVYTNNPGIMYYSGRIRDDLARYAVSTHNIDKILDDSTNDNYVAFQIKNKNKKLNQWLSARKGESQIIEFKNTNNDKIVIFNKAKQTGDNTNPQ